ncbi:hypothetical protein RB623_20415 [Mesorhizobium sp. LHD-90]|uniref:hypothetical protein n=1 Tax=Mesorhizobium sp. LHD-90 TaxID=3071414 RepID=UPI0027DF9680|nr:hypothetical protein [Mesorhizobium sp. LHD-90]MDQ6436421.1 hypothetical protein [Mesorhizobium sp. LHD-90]
MKLVHNSACMFTVLLLASPVCAQEMQKSCSEEQQGVIDSKNGTENYYSGSINFESKVVEYNGISKKYIWCIENNVNNYLINIEWGDQANPKKYFDGIVPPGKIRPRIRTHTSGTDSGDRTLKFRTNMDSWHSLDVETIFYKKLGFSLDKDMTYVQLNRPELAPYLNSEGNVDIERLESDREYLSGFLKAGGEIVYVSGGVFDLPANEKVARLLKNGEYEKYNPEDFFAIDLNVLSRLAMIEGNEQVSTFMTAEYASDDDLKKAASAFSSNPLIVEVSAGSQVNKYLDVPVGGYFMEAKEKTFVPFATNTNAKDIEILPASLSFKDKDGGSFGSLTTNIIVPDS